MLRRDFDIFDFGTAMIRLTKDAPAQAGAVSVEADT